MITLFEIRDALVNLQPTLWQTTKKEQTLSDLYFLSKNNSGQSSVLYLGTVSAIFPTIEKLQNMSLLLIEDEPLTVRIRSELLQQGCSLILLPKGNDLFEMFNLVQKLFSEKQWFYQQSYALYNEIVISKDLSQMMSLAERVFNNPVILIDESFKVLHYSKRMEVTDEIWANNIRNGYCSFEFITEVSKLNAVKKSQSTIEPFSVECHANTIIKWVSKLYGESDLMGYLVVPECHSHMERMQVKFLSELGRGVAHYLGKSTLRNSPQLHHSEKLFKDLIKERIHSESELSARLKLSRISSTGPHRLIMITAHSTNGKKKPTESIHTQLLRLFPESQQILYKNALLLLLSQKEWLKNLTTKQNLTEILEQKNYHAIYSNEITDLLRLSLYYRQLNQGLQLAMSLGKKDILLSYNDVKFYQLLEDSGLKGELLHFCHPAIWKLLNHDQKFNTAYYETLQAYLLNKENLNETANQLYVHRNTIKYRLGKINELTNVDVTSGETVFQLAYTFKILQFQEQVGR